MTPITKPMLGMKFVRNEKKPQTSGSGTPEQPQRSGVEDADDGAEQGGHHEVASGCR